MLRYWVTWISIIYISIGTPVYAVTNSPYLPTGASFAFGHGIPNSTMGYRITLRRDWSHIWFANRPLEITGFWDASFANWFSRGDYLGHNKSIVAVGFGPVFRFQPGRPACFMKPYLELSMSPAWLSHTWLGRRNLGSHFTLQDLFGLGMQFGMKKQWDFSYHYLHYSNASLAQPNEGIDVKLLFTLAYRWS